MTHVTCRLTAKNRDQLRNPALGNRVWASFTFLETLTEALDVKFSADRAYAVLPGLPQPCDQQTDRQTDRPRYTCSNRPRTLETLTEALGVEFSADRADAGLTGLPLLQASIEFFLQCDHLEAGRRHAGHRLDPQRQVLRPFPTHADITRANSVFYPQWGQPGAAFGVSVPHAVPPSRDAWQACLDPQRQVLCPFPTHANTTRANSALYPQWRMRRSVAALWCVSSSCRPTISRVQMRDRHAWTHNDRSSVHSLHTQTSPAPTPPGWSVCVCLLLTVQNVTVRCCPWCVSSDHPGQLSLLSSAGRKMSKIAVL